MAEDSDNRRVAEREAVLKSAKIIFGDALVDCLVLDVSSTGARVRTGAVVPVPDQVVLQFQSGGRFPARRRWARGLQIGFEFAGAAVLRGRPADQARAAGDALRAEGVPEAIRLLHGVNFFDDLVLRRLAEDARDAYERLEAALARRAGDGPADAAAPQPGAVLRSAIARRA